MGPIKTVCMGKVGPLDVIVMLDANGDVQRAIYASSGADVPNDTKIDLHSEYGCFKIA